jgi:acyltransferase-like protein
VNRLFSFSQPPKHLSHLFELDVFRGLMSWWVVVGHVLAFAGFQENNVPSVIEVVMHGEYAVKVFMMMSGFVIAKLLADKNESYKVFITRRFLRLYPVFLVALVVAILARPLYIPILLASRAPLPYHYDRIWVAENDHFWPHILAHLSMRVRSWSLPPSLHSQRLRPSVLRPSCIILLKSQGSTLDVGCSRIQLPRLSVGTPYPFPRLLCNRFDFPGLKAWAILCSPFRRLEQTTLSFLA